MTQSDKEILKSLSQDPLIEHDVETCGMCFYNLLMVTIAKELCNTESPTLQAWQTEVNRQWQEGKFYKLWQQVQAEGKDPKAVFKEKGWDL